MGFVNWVNGQDKIIKILLFIPIWGWVIAFLYRLFLFINDTTKSINLIGAILGVIPFTGFFLSIIDLVMVIINGKPTILVEE